MVIELPKLNTEVVLHELQKLAAFPPGKHRRDTRDTDENRDSGFLERTRFTFANQGSGDSGSVQTWFDDEYDLIEDCQRAAISGLALSIAFSTTFWAGVALIVTRVLR
jgi:hypothetical protein